VKTSEKALKTKWFQILLAMADRDLHGSAIMEEVLLRTDGEIRLWPGALYGALKELSAQGLIVEIDPPADAPTEGGKRRFYRITGKGRERLAAEVDRMAALVRVARSRNVVGQEAV
jgi:DNA-binding PadR family transcriptional regulator